MNFYAFEYMQSTNAAFTLPFKADGVLSRKAHPIFVYLSLIVEEHLNDLSFSILFWNLEQFGA